VNLKNYDLMILVDVAQVSTKITLSYGVFNWLAQNVIGMSVVQGDYDKLKRFNLAEIYDPSPKSEPAGTATESKA
jgi:tRNA acetyltransferase TAN1